MEYALKKSYPQIDSQDVNNFCSYLHIYFFSVIIDVNNLFLFTSSQYFTVFFTDFLLESPSTFLLLILSGYS